MTTDLFITLVVAALGSGGVAGVVTLILNRRKVDVEVAQIQAETDLAYAREFRKDLEVAKGRIAELERDMLNMHREMKELTRENIELRKKVAKLEAENQRLESLLAGKNWPMAYGPEIRDAVRGAYVHERLPLAQAARRADVRYETARSWKRQDKARGDCWDMARDAARLVKGGLGEVSAGFLENFVRLFQSTVKGLEEAREKDKDRYNPIEVAEALSRLSDAYVKTARAMTQTNPKLSRLSVAYEVMEELTAFIREQHPDKLAEWVDMLEPFSRKVSEVFGA